MLSVVAICKCLPLHVVFRFWIWLIDYNAHCDIEDESSVLYFEISVWMHEFIIIHCLSFALCECCPLMSMPEDVKINTHMWLWQWTSYFWEQGRECTHCLSILICEYRPLLSISEKIKIMHVHMTVFEEIKITHTHTYTHTRDIIFCRWWLWYFCEQGSECAHDYIEFIHCESLAFCEYRPLMSTSEDMKIITWHWQWCLYFRWQVNECTAITLSNLCMPTSHGHISTNMRC